MQDRDTGEASRAEQETWEAMTDQETRGAMADQETRGAMADQETLWPWPGHYGHGYMPPPKKILGRIRKSGGLSGGAGSGGCLRVMGSGGRLQGAELANLGNSGDGGLDGTSRGEGDSGDGERLDGTSGGEGDSGVRIGAENSGGSAISMSAGACAGGLDIPANGGLE